MVFCRKCGRALPGGFKVCSGCNAPVPRPSAEAVARRCARCARDITLEPPDLRMCPSCRTPL